MVPHLVSAGWLTPGAEVHHLVVEAHEEVLRGAHKQARDNVTGQVQAGAEQEPSVFTI